MYVIFQVLAALLLDLRLWAAAPAAVQQNLFALCLKLSQVRVPLMTLCVMLLCWMLPTLSFLETAACAN